jgi:Holliday junction DNA helicase RuvB
MTEDKAILSGSALEEDSAVEPKLRPQTLSEYIGQTKVRENLAVFLKAARGRGEPLDHVLLTGPPGLGKTTLAYIIARDGRARLTPTDAARAGDLAGSDEPPGEGRPLRGRFASRRPSRILYPAMEDFRLDIVIGEGPMAPRTSGGPAGVHAHRRDGGRAFSPSRPCTVRHPAAPRLTTWRR